MKINSVKKVINEAIHKSDELSLKIKVFKKRIASKKIEDEKSILNDILELVSQNKTNQGLLNLLSDFLSMNDNQEILDKTDFNDIEKLLKCNIKHHPFDITINEDIIYFYWCYLDDEKKSKYHIKKAIKKIESRLSKLKLLLKEIESESKQ